ncbi:fluoride efflux transporter CrcB [Phnomibacter sp.]|uniref:fluoride efflux transporter CrcB n=1 Tax=Phnomibacter sp. TaxID=2836217 RepID=UPI002FDEBE13
MMMGISIYHIFLVAMGGMLGSVLRFIAGTFIMQKAGTAFPWGTFAVNIAGSLLIGWVAGQAAKHPGFQAWQLLLATGFCGGVTTFSALSNESLQMLRQQQYGLLSLYISASLILGIGAAALGFTLSK